MPAIDRILCPIDFSEFSVNAYEYAQSLAWHYQATLFLHHVIESLMPYDSYYAFPDSYMETCQRLREGAEKQLEEFAKAHRQGEIQLQCEVQDGVVTDSILSLAEAKAVNLIVMGTHGLRGVDRLTLGSVTEKVIRKARCPVLAVRKPAHGFVSQPGGPDLIHPHRILCCTDSPDHSDLAWDHAVSIAEEYGAELTLLHVMEDIASSSDIETATTKTLERLERRIAAGARKNGITKAAVRIGKAYQQIIEFALESRTDVVSMGARGRHALDLAIFGSTTYRVIQLGPCPVIAVQAEQREA
jgi:nucleotide-binding universal stress UspA family protein